MKWHEKKETEVEEEMSSRWSKSQELPKATAIGGVFVWGGGRGRGKSLMKHLSVSDSQ